MSAPDLCHALVLEKPQLVEDGAGGFTQGWVVLGTLWAQVTAGSARETDAAGTPVSLTSYKVVVRGAPWGTPERPAPGQRFRDGTRVFNIDAVTERDPQGRYLTCYAQEELVV